MPPFKQGTSRQARRRILTALLFASSPLSAQSARTTETAELSGAEFYRRAQSAAGLAAKGDHRGAVGILRQLVAQNPNDPLLWRSLANSLEALGDPVGAIAAYRKELAVGAPSATFVEYRIARQFALADQRDSALAWLDRALGHRFEIRGTLATDTAFAEMRKDPRFARVTRIASNHPDRVDAWREDLTFFVSEAQRMHAGFEREAFAPGFLAQAARIRDSIPRWSDGRVTVELRRLATLLGDGHSTVRARLARLPLSFYAFSDGVFITAARDNARLVGARVDSIGSISIAQAMERVKKYTPRDNDMGLLNLGPVYLTQPATLEAIGAIADTVAVDLALRGADGRHERVRITPVRDSPAIVALPAPAVAASRPLYQRDTSTLWMTRLPNGRGVYLQYNAVASPQGETITAFAARLLDTLQRSREKNLVIDMRNNGGGNTYLFPPLLDAVISFATTDTSRRVFLIIGRATFSAAQNFATLAERFIPGIITVGEPSGSRPNFVGESPTVRLPHSGLVTIISTRYHQNVDITDKRMWIAPIVPAPLSSKDYFANRDPAMEAIIDLLARPLP